MLLIASASLWAQNGTPTADVQANADDQKTEQPESPRTFFGQTFAGHWAFTTEFSYGQEYDDNVFSSSLIRLSDNVSRISARFTAAVQKKHLRVQFHYYPDYVSYLKYSDRNALSHRFADELDYSFSGRTDLSWKLDASRAPGYTGSPLQLVSFDTIQLPVFNPAALQSDATILNANSNLSLTHRFSARSSVSFGLQGSVVRFTPANGIPVSTLFSQNSYSGGGDLGWDYEFVPKRKIGIELCNTYFGFLDPSSHSYYQFAKLRYSQSFGHGYQFSMGAGPSRRETQANPLFGLGKIQSTGYAADLSLSKVSERQTIGVTYNHGSQLGLTQGSIASDSVSLSAMRKIGRKWHADGSFSYSLSNSASVLSPSDNSSYAVSASLGYQLRRDLDFTAGYSYVNELIGQGLPGSLGFDRNIYRVGLHYTFQWLTSR